MPSFLNRRPWATSHETQPALPRTDEDVWAALRLLPQYRVLLYNDDVHTMDYVVMALIRAVPRLSLEDAARIMLQAHQEGQAQVIVCPRETAEFYREALELRGLTSTIEPV